MKFQIQVGTKGSTDSWWESYDKEEVTDEATAQSWATETIQMFNDSIRNPKERPRRFIGGVRILGEGSKEHRWVKQNWGTKSDHRGSFDMMKCERCGCEGRRYALGQFGVKRGATWKAKKWKNCPGKSGGDIPSERK